METAQNVITRTEGLVHLNEHELQESRADAKYLLAQSLYFLGRVDEAIPIFMESLELYASLYGWNNGAVIFRLLEVEGWLDKCGKYEQAKKVRRKRNWGITMLPQLKSATKSS